MKKVFYFTLILGTLLSKAQTWTWAEAGNGPGGYAEGLGICTDKNNNAIITGFFQSPTIAFGTYTLNKTGGSNVYVAKYNSSGVVQWAKCSSGPLGQEGRCICADTAGNVYVTGETNGSNIVFDTYTLTNNTSVMAFLVKYDPNGNVLWARSSNANSCVSQSVRTDINGNVFMSGWYLGSSAVFGSYTLASTATVNAFVVKYDPNGNVLWAKGSSGTGYHYSYGISSDNVGNSYMTGIFKSGAISFGTYTLSNPSAKEDVFLAKFDPAGNVQWMAAISGTSVERSNFCGTDQQNNVYLVGNFGSSSLAIGNNTLTNTGSTDVFLAKFDPNGNPLWARSIIGSGADNGYCVSTHSSGVWISGSMGSIVGPGGGSPVTIGSYSLTPPPGSYDPLFLAQYDANGTVLYACALASGGDDMAAISTGTDCSLYLSGDYYNVNPFVIGSYSLALSGTESIFTSKLVCNSTPDRLLDLKGNSPFVIYPNPAKDFLILESMNENFKHIELYNSFGRKVWQTDLQTLQLRTGLDVSDLPEGVYVLNISGGDRKSLNQKFVIQR